MGNRNVNGRYDEVRQHIVDAKLLKIIAASHPELIKEAQKNITPVMNDLALIAKVYDEVCLSYNPKTDFQHKLLFIASILRLFNPEALVIDCKLRHGLRVAIAKCLDHSGPSTTYYINQARAYMKIRSFKAAVGQITENYSPQNLVS
jgi:hypothetical protein